jgi:lipoprotein-releasing system permease protein
MSKLPFELLLALRYLRPKRTFVSIITLISVLGVALGVAVLIIVISVMSGFDHDFRETITGYQPHVTIYSVYFDKKGHYKAKAMGNYGDVMRMIASNKSVLGVAPDVSGQVLLETQPTNGGQSQVIAPVVRGIDPDNTNSAGILLKHIVAGEFDLSGRGLVVGDVFARNLDLSIGDRVSIYSPGELKKMKAHQGKADAEAVLPDDYEVRGIFDTGYYAYNADIVVTSLENGQDLFELNDSVLDLTVKLKDPYQAGKVKLELENTLGQNYEVDTWEDQNSAFLSALFVEKNVMFYLLFFIVLVAALCILSAQITFVVQKTREIGMLKALGATRPQITGIFVFQSAIIGFIGVASGFGLGMLAVTYRNEFLHFMRRATGWELFPASMYGFGELPAVITPSDIAVICGCSFVICILGGVLPAIRAGKLKPVEALRYE